MRPSKKPSEESPEQCKEFGRAAFKKVDREVGDGNRNGRMCTPRKEPNKKWDAHKRIPSDNCSINKMLSKARGY